jgi:hypothetical protein
MQQTSIYVRHLNAHYLVMHEQTDAVMVQRRLDRIARESLSRHLEQCFVGVPDEAYYFIKRMEVGGVLDFNWDDELLGRTWAAAVRDNMLRTISRGGSSVKVFHDRGEYVAHFLEDLLRGCAWEQWYYRAYERLRALPLGQIISKVLAEDGDAGRDALLELTRRGDLDLLLAALDDAEVAAMVNVCLLPPSRGVVSPNMLVVWVQALRAILRETPLGPALARDVARLYLTILRRHPELGPDVNLARFIRDALRLRQSVMSLERPRGFLTMLESDNWARALHQLSSESEQAWLLDLTRQLGGPEVAALLRDLQTDATQKITRRVSTPFGGLFLLAPAILDLGLRAFLKECVYPSPSFASKSSLLCYLIGLQCLGQENAEKARRDQGLALFAGLEAIPTPAQLEQYSEDLTAQVHREFEAEFRARQQKLAGRFPITHLDHDPSHLVPGFEWFSFATARESSLSARALDTSLAPVSQAVSRSFAAKLGALSASSPQYLSRNFWESHAEILMSDENISVRFLTCPLQMILRMAGFDQQSWTLPWLSNRNLEFRFD